MTKHLGKILLSVAYAETVPEASVLAGELVSSIPSGTADLDRIILIVPDRIRRELGWPEHAAPRAVIYDRDLVFRAPGTIDP